MNPNQPTITGIGSVSPFGPLRGLIRCKEMEPRNITAWPTDGVRRAFLVEPFRPADVIPGLKTRRLDRLSVWCLVAAGLAIQDAQLDLDAEDRSRIAVVLGTGFACIELTESFFQSIATNGYGKSDPIIFPEAVSNAPASHVARIFGLRGPNITLSHKGVSGEGALMQAASLLRTGQADVVVAFAGDALTRTMYEWFEAAHVLSPACFSQTPVPVPFAHGQDGFVPGEGVGAVVMEPAGRATKRGAHFYAGFRSGHATSNPKAAASVVRRSLAPSVPSEVKIVVASANGSRAHDEVESGLIREVFGDGTPLIAPKAILGESDGSGILRLIVALSQTETSRSLVLLLGTCMMGVCAAVSFELP
jgi:3-oxoacyl-[acyl-carrier-protein] synthase II